MRNARPLWRKPRCVIRDAEVELQDGCRKSANRSGRNTRHSSKARGRRLCRTRGKPRYESTIRTRNSQKRTLDVRPSRMAGLSPRAACITKCWRSLRTPGTCPRRCCARFMLWWKTARWSRDGQDLMKDSRTRGLGRRESQPAAIEWTFFESRPSVFPTEQRAARRD